MRSKDIKGYISDKIVYICLCVFAFSNLVIFIVLFDRYIYSRLDFSFLSLVGNAPKIGPGKVKLFVFLTLLSLIITAIMYKFFNDGKQKRYTFIVFLILYMFQFSLISIIDYTMISNGGIVSLNQDQSKQISKAESKLINQKIDLIMIRQLVEKEDPNVKCIETDLELTIYLRDYVYSNINLKKTTPGFDFSDLLKSYKLSIKNPNQGHICGGLSILYQTLLEAFGIQSRYVGLFTNTSYPYDSHATVEIYIDGKWIASDPTFNVMFKKDDVYLGYSEIREILLKDGSCEIETNNMQIDPVRRIEDYYAPMKKLVEYIVIYPAYTIQNGMERQYDYVILPKEWNGKLVGPDSKDIDLLDFSEDNIIFQLPNGILR